MFSEILLFEFFLYLMYYTTFIRLFEVTTIKSRDHTNLTTLFYVITVNETTLARLLQLATVIFTRTALCFNEQTLFCFSGNSVERKATVDLHVKNISRKFGKVLHALPPDDSQSNLKVESCKLYNNKYIMASTEITNTGFFAFIVALAFKLFSVYVLFINRRDTRNC